MMLPHRSRCESDRYRRRGRKQACAGRRDRRSCVVARSLAAPVLRRADRRPALGAADHALAGRPSARCVAPAFHRRVHDADPRGAAGRGSLAMNVIYFRVLIILMSLIATATQTGLFATSVESSRSVRHPLAGTVGCAARARDRRSGQRQADAIRPAEDDRVGLLTAAYLVIVIVLLAEPAIALLGGSEYTGAAPMLAIQGFALIGASADRSGNSACSRSASSRRWRSPTGSRSHGC